MHRLAATPGGWNPDLEGVIFVEQSPAPLVLLTAADTEIQTLAQVLPELPSNFPGIRVTNLLQLQQQLTIDTYADSVLERVQAIVVRLLGGRAYWPYGLEVLQETVARTGAHLIILPGDDRPDPDLMGLSTLALGQVHRLWRYFTEGGVDNSRHALLALADLTLGTAYHPPAPREVPKIGIYAWQGQKSGEGEGDEKNEGAPKVGLLFYRAHYLAGNTAPVDALCQALAARGIEPIPVYVSSLRDLDLQEELLSLLQPKHETGVQVLLNATSFSVAQLDGEQPNLDLWQRLDVPVLQVIFSGGTMAQWRDTLQGLSPRDTAMNVALPEVDGRIISRAISFKTVQHRNTALETDVVRYEPVRDRVEFVADLAAHWVRLRQTPVAERKVALILANYPTRDGRLANGVGLDTPESCIRVLKALAQAGYTVTDAPETGDELIRRLTAGVTNDPEGWELWQMGLRSSISLSRAEYERYFASLPEAVQQEIRDRWGDPAGDHFPIPGLQLGHVFVGIQPARGYDLDPALNYHAPDLEPPHGYLAFYSWLRQHFGAQAMVHVGKHGNLEWLPGKSLALSQTCYPEVALGPLPHLYPFIVNDPGEGSQAKRRAQAVILDHLTPPLTRAELYGPLQQLEQLVDEYYEAQTLDPSRLSALRDRIVSLVVQENLHRELGLTEQRVEGQGKGQETNTELDAAPLLTQIDGYLCELKEAQIRDGLHILGHCPQGRQLRDLIIAIARSPSAGRLGLTRAIAQDCGLEFDPLTADLGEAIGNQGAGLRARSCRTVGDAVEWLEHTAADLVDRLIQADIQPGKSLDLKTVRFISTPSPLNSDLSPRTTAELQWIANSLLPVLQQTDQEIGYLLRGLDGRYVPSGPSGAPTRGRPEVLPTGRNFYSVDIRAIPTESAWDVGRKAAEVLIEDYTQANGEYPKTLGLSVWGTSTMRTGGDDVAEALALLGVRPVWDGPSRRVVDFEILPLTVLGRPRVDVTLRISGFFRDAFPNLIDLFDQAVAAVAALQEPPDQNPLAATVQQEAAVWQAQGLSQDQAEARSRYRIFGSKPGAYGAGLQGLIEAQNWTDDQDLARAYINWSSYAYGRGAEGRSAPEAFEQRLQQMQIVLHNQDNREHDLLDSDDYYQFQGGLTVAVRALTGQNPTTYFGDHSRPENPKVRLLREEIARVYRSRVVNPKWIEGVMRHGYKGAFEMAATVDYLFAYDATARCGADYLYEGIADAYLLNPTVQAFVQRHNPWALRDMAERLIEAHQRGLWSTADVSLLDQLRAIAHAAEGQIEDTSVGAGLGSPV